jgi:hypothetical protein
MNYSNTDMIFLTIQMRIENRSKTIYVHNIYNLFSLLYSLIESLSMLSKIRRHLINCQDHQILLNDFNLHHFLWNKFTRFTQYAVANQLLNLIKNLDLFLIFSIDNIIWEARNVQSTINLIFMIESLANRMIYYNIRSNLN